MAACHRCGAGHLSDQPHRYVTCVGTLQAQLEVARAELDAERKVHATTKLALAKAQSERGEVRALVTKLAAELAQ